MKRNPVSGAPDRALGVPAAIHKRWMLVSGYFADYETTRMDQSWFPFEWDIYYEATADTKPGVYDRPIA